MSLQSYIKQNKPLQVKRGLFTKAYIYKDTVILATTDPIKECLALDWFPDSVHFPVIEKTDSQLDDITKTFNVYTATRYTTSRNVKDIITEKDYINLYKPLREVYKNIRWSYVPYHWKDDFTQAINNSTLSKHYKRLLITAYEACMAYSNKVKFEISPRNVAANKNKRLILLDCFFITK